MDYYIEKPEKLEGQPKRTIADYVEQNEILVPHRFDSLSEARKSGVSIICRSEHCQDYNGASGLLKSPDLSKFPDTNDEIELKEKILESFSISHRIKRYCRLMGLDQANFIDEVSFSFWEKLSGYNRTVVADTAVQGRYHIMTVGEKRGTYTVYSVFENGDANTLQAAWTRDGPIMETNKKLENLVKLYESIRHLDRFDPNNCPMMEFQTAGEKDYFLQYHRGREFNQAKFELKRRRRWREIRPLFVRGATSPEGAVYRISVVYPNSWKDNPIPKSEEGFFGAAGVEEIYPELMARKWKLRVIPDIWGLGFTLIDVAGIGHVARSQLYKPEVSLIVDSEKFMKEKEFDKLPDSCTDKPSCIDVFAISDGRKAFVKII